MVAKSRIEKIEAEIDRLHQSRIIPPLMRWIQEQDTKTLQILRDRLDSGQDILEAMKGLPQ